MKIPSDWYSVTVVESLPIKIFVAVCNRCLLRASQNWRKGIFPCFLELSFSYLYHLATVFVFQTESIFATVSKTLIIILAKTYRWEIWGHKVGQNFKNALLYLGIFPTYDQIHWTNLVGLLVLHVIQKVQVENPWHFHPERQNLACYKGGGASYPIIVGTPSHFIGSYS